MGYETFERLCNEKGVTPYRVAKDTGVTTATLSSWKSGRYTPKADKLQKLADYFGVGVEVFFEDDVQTSQEIQVNQEHVDEVIEIVEKNPRITLWSSKSSAVFRYLRKTEPEFSISKEASVLIEEAVAKKYPEIWDLFEDLKQLLEIL